MNQPTTRGQAVKLLNKALPKTDGIFRDESWIPVNHILSSINDLDWVEVAEGGDTQYRSENGIPVEKYWNRVYDVSLTTGKVVKVYLHISASGAGTVEYPLSAYDVVAYFS